MAELMSGIKTVHGQYCGTRKRSLPQPDLNSSIRRVHSSAVKRPSNLSITMATTTKEKTPENLSQELYDPDLSQGSTLSASSQNSQSAIRQRSVSAAASLKFRPNKPSPVSIQSAVSCNNIEEPWLPATPIHELPESPTFVSTTSLSNSSSSLHCYSIHGTAPRNGYRRSCSVSSPPASSNSNHRSPIVLTSTPNISQPYEKENYHTLPNVSMLKASLSERVCTIPEDEVDYANVTDSLSQLSSCTDEGSPKNGSTIITRRSSLTGQIEHYRKPRLLTKKNSQPLDLMKEASIKPNLSRSAPKLSTSGSSSSKDSGFKVLNRVRKSKRYSQRTTVFLPSIETTV